MAVAFTAALSCLVNLSQSMIVWRFVGVAVLPATLSTAMWSMTAFSLACQHIHR